jgi:hypothetical protein
LSEDLGAMLWNPHVDVKAWRHGSSLDLRLVMDW